MEPLRYYIVTAPTDVAEEWHAVLVLCRAQLKESPLAREVSIAYQKLSKLIVRVAANMPDQPQVIEIEANAFKASGLLLYLPPETAARLDPSRLPDALLSCPFCGSGVDNSSPRPWPHDRLGNWCARCGNPNCEAEIVGATPEEVTRRWNRRKLEPPRTVLSIVTDDEYKTGMTELESLMQGDPAADSAEGRRLHELAVALEIFESKQWPTKR